MDRNCDQPTSTTTSVVDDTTPHITPPAHRRGRAPPRRINTKV